jgi:hypothetical protein
VGLQQKREFRLRVVAGGRTASAERGQAAVSRRSLALPVLLAGAFLPVLDFNVVNLALPAIRQDLGATAGDVQFVISAYAAAFAVFLITGGRLGDLYGVRPCSCLARRRLAATSRFWSQPACCHFCLPDIAAPSVMRRDQCDEA